MLRWLDDSRERGAAIDLRCVRSLHRVSQRRVVLRLLVLCSRVADGPVWVGVLLLLPLIAGQRGAEVAWVGLGLGAVNLVLYWTLKQGTRRLRPFHRCDDIVACVRAADRFSFPSGHTLHAVSFALLFSAAWPSLAWPLWTFAVLVGLSRIVLGLHYPSDVAVGVGLGLLTASGAAALL